MENYLEEFLEEKKKREGLNKNRVEILKFRMPEEYSIFFKTKNFSEIKKIKVELLRTWQRRVDDSAVLKYFSQDFDKIDPISVLYDGDFFYIKDGNHRANAAILHKYEYILAKVWDLSA